MSTALSDSCWLADASPSLRCCRDAASTYSKAQVNHSSLKLKQAALRMQQTGWYFQLCSKYESYHQNTSNTRMLWCRALILQRRAQQADSPGACCRLQSGCHRTPCCPQHPRQTAGLQTPGHHYAAEAKLHPPTAGQGSVMTGIVCPASGLCNAMVWYGACCSVQHKSLCLA